MLISHKNSRFVSQRYSVLISVGLSDVLTFGVSKLLRTTYHLHHGFYVVDRQNTKRKNFECNETEIYLTFITPS
jgi:hypothetical protein